MTVQEIIAQIILPDFKYTVNKKEYRVEDCSLEQINDFVDMGFEFPFTPPHRKIELLGKVIYDHNWPIQKQNKILDKLFAYSLNEIERQLISEMDGIHVNPTLILLNETENKLSEIEYYYKSDVRLHEPDKHILISISDDYDYNAASRQLQTEVPYAQKLLSPYFRRLKGFIQELRVIVLEAFKTRALNPDLETAKVENNSSSQIGAEKVGQQSGNKEEISKDQWGVDRIQNFKAKLPRLIATSNSLLTLEIENEKPLKLLTKDDLSEFFKHLNSVKHQGTIIWRGNKRTLNALFSGISSDSQKGKKYTQIKRQLQGKILPEDGVKPIDLGGIRSNLNLTNKEPYKTLEDLGIDILNIINS